MLAVLNGWVSASDHQFFYDDSPPNLVRFFDHGSCFPNGPDWTINHLERSGPGEPDLTIIENCLLEQEVIREACKFLDEINIGRIAWAVGAIPTGWCGVNFEEKLAIAEFLYRRCMEIQTD